MLYPLNYWPPREAIARDREWRCIALVNGNIEAVSGPAAQDRPGAHEWLVWQGTALKCAEKADPRVDLEWMRIRHERDLIKR
jgi:hypothetical protein